MINDRKIHVWVADPNVPDSAKHNDHFDLPSEDAIEFNRYGEVRKAPRLVQHIMSVVGPKFTDRDGGYTRIVKIGKRRLGDGTDLVVLQLVGEEEGPQIGGGDSRRRTQKQRRRDFAAKVLVSAASVAEVADEPSETPAEEKPLVDEAADDAIVDEEIAKEEEETTEEVTAVEEAPAAPEADTPEEDPSEATSDDGDKPQE
jgi:large subunit ribosomal protein L17